MPFLASSIALGEEGLGGKGKGKKKGRGRKGKSSTLLGATLETYPLLLLSRSFSRVWRKKKKRKGGEGGEGEVRVNQEQEGHSRLLTKYYEHYPRPPEERNK